jgi:hypothetical protein
MDPKTQRCDLVESNHRSAHFKVTDACEIKWTNSISGDTGCEIQMAALSMGVVFLDPAMRSRVAISTELEGLKKLNRFDGNFVINIERASFGDIFH